MLNMLKEIRYETPTRQIDFTQKTVFLAGPTVRGNQPHLKSWRPDAVNFFHQYGFNGNIIIPEFSVRTVSDKYRYDLPAWEFEGLRRCDVILFWIPRTRDLIGLTTNYELGYWTARCRDKVIYGRPDDAYRIAYCDVMWYEDGKVYAPKDQNFPVYNTLDKAVKAAIDKVSV